MVTSTLKKTAIAVAVAGTFAAGAIPEAEANVVNLSWRGAFLMLNPAGSPLVNSPSDYVSGYYANGDGNSATFGSPHYPGNVGPGAIPSGTYPGAYQTAYGWNGVRTPISGTISFDTSSGAGVGTVNPFFFFGDSPGSGPGTTVVHFSDVTFQALDPAGTIVGSMLLSWNDDSYQASIVLDGNGLFTGLIAALNNGGPTSSISGVGALPATDGINFGTTAAPIFHPLGPSPIATKTVNTGAGCDGLSLATQVNAYTITTNISNLGVCATGMVDDGIGGDPMTGAAKSNFNINLDYTSVHLGSFVPTPVPLPAAAWLFGSGLLGFIGRIRRKRIIKKNATNVMFRP